jgi:hypothetical protein
VFKAPPKEEFERNVSYRHKRKRRVVDEGKKWRRKRGKNICKINT